MEEEIAFMAKLGLIIQNIGIIGLLGSLLHNFLKLNLIKYTSNSPYIFLICIVVSTLLLFYFDKKSEIDIKPMKRPIE
jgi:hypothetical protein